MNSKLVTIAEGRKTVTVTRELRGEFMITVSSFADSTNIYAFLLNNHSTVFTAVNYTKPL